ncbi:MAG TPA: DNA helicase RecQ [Deltaproteobacteria bacterium]|nr:MAG: ATP-dependent DNA helicase RecQ [Deltaproteobacteria bacterium GWA2_45_12]HBF12319.1 DNA helicase RecQ [Deltaproteobacteria bacterium]
MVESSFLLSALKKHFGFSHFRPLQEEIINEVLDNRDVFALLPTGGGKSLCFQLPALIKPGLTLVISPLIALMKDQVDALVASGIAATFLNSSLDAEEFSRRLRDVESGHYRLLYIAPERLMLPHFLERVKNWDISLIAIDEAHCISEWGHDFRPEYRKLSELKKYFPNIPILALTATATGRVHQDILSHLKLQNPRTFIASFNRPNLNYRVTPKDKAAGQVIQFVRARPGQSGIIYCHSRKGTETLSEKLSAVGIRAKPYHAGLSPELRSRHQELFSRDEIQVVCATIAFGMGINKSNVRFVIHADLPKNVEGYYQETGRAGRDGLPSECLLLFSAGDVVKQKRFIDEKEDPQERKIAWAQLQQMVDYAEGAICRRKILLNYFGEKFEKENCGGCDNCLSPKAQVDGTMAAQKFLSCIYRIREKNTFGMGLNHTVDILVGAQNEKIFKFTHQNLSTYGIGKDISRNLWLSIGRELIRLGLVICRDDQFGALELSEKGRLILRERKTVMLSQTPKTKVDPIKRNEDSSYDEELFERLRVLRKELADAQDVPAYIIFSDATLRQMARDRPTDHEAFLQITGVGTKKLESFGKIFQTAIQEHLQSGSQSLK